MLKHQKILYFGGKDWWYHNISVGARLALNFAKMGNQVLYVNSIPLRRPKLGRKGSKARYLNKLKSFSKFLKKVEKNLWVMTPIFIPIYDGYFSYTINQHLLIIQLRLAKKILGWCQELPIVFSATLAAALVLPKIKRKIALYHLVDKYDKYRDFSDKNWVSEMDNILVKESDILLCSSKEIFKYYKKLKSECYYVPHGVDFELFNKAATCELEKPWDLQGIKAPIIGYFGSLTESNDQDVLAYCAQKKPNWSIVLIGEVYGDYSKLKKYANIYFLGKKDLQELPAYGKYFDVCIMNWVMNEWMHYCNPVKAKEYLAMGKPVVSVPIPEVIQTLGDVVSIASTPAEFLEKIEWELQNDCFEKRKKRIEKVRHETWDKKTEEISNLILEYLQIKSGGNQVPSQGVCKITCN